MPPKLTTRCRRLNSAAVCATRPLSLGLWQWGDLGKDVVGRVGVRPARHRHGEPVARRPVNGRGKLMLGPIGLQPVVRRSDKLRLLAQMRACGHDDKEHRRGPHEDKVPDQHRPDRHAESDRDPNGGKRMQRLDGHEFGKGLPCVECARGHVAPHGAMAPVVDPGEMGEDQAVEDRRIEMLKPVPREPVRMGCRTDQRRAFPVNVGAFHVREMVVQTVVTPAPEMS